MKKKKISLASPLLSLVLCVAIASTFLPDLFKPKIIFCKTISEKAECNFYSGNKININTADIKELCLLPGIGETMANNIIEYRNTNGGFKNTDELLNVRGIGEKKLEKIKNKIILY